MAETFTWGGREISDPEEIRELKSRGFNLAPVSKTEEAPKSGASKSGGSAQNKEG